MVDKSSGLRRKIGVMVPRNRNRLCESVLERNVTSHRLLYRPVRVSNLHDCIIPCVGDFCKGPQALCIYQGLGCGYVSEWVHDFS